MRTFIATNLLMLLAVLGSCDQSAKRMNKEKPFTNSLIHESSPYLLQHAHNPVDWRPWNDQSLALAKEENKLLLISIGYAACHWCHVMEAESFEDTAVAQVMNRHFVNIKVDREERPDVDQVYMSAVELMTGRAGWPLNVIALPDGRPVWGGTYFPKEAWLQRIGQIQKIYQEEPGKLEEYAKRLASGIRAMDLVEMNRADVDFTKIDYPGIKTRWAQKFDLEYGGYKGAPKFMLPDNFRYLLRQAVEEGDQDLLGYVELTLRKMAYGGLYDHVGGGFARYSTDSRWHVPHFEKMLYDNAQLLRLYSQAYRINQKPLYREVVRETIAFVERELMGPEGAFYSSLDADSRNEDGELEEGAFYTFKQEELKSLLKEEYELFSAYYNINDFGKWENNRYVLIRTRSDSEFCEEFQVDPNELAGKRNRWKELLNQYRDQREKPGLDDKSLTSWNAWMLTGLVEAYKALGDEHYLEMARANAVFLDETQKKADNGLYHSYKEGQSTINGYLEDYAAVIQAFLALHQVTLEQRWLARAQELADYCFEKFSDPESGLFYFTSSDDADLVSRPREYRDNVIPSSNSVLANGLYLLAHYRNKPVYEETAAQMLKNVLPELQQYPGSFSNWLWLLRNFTGEFYEVVVVGNEARSYLKRMQARYLTGLLWSGSEGPADAFLLKNRFVEGKTLIYLCVDNACRLPTEDINSTLNKLENGRN